MNERRSMDQMSEVELREKLAKGELSDEEYQAQMRRRAASRNPEDLPDSTDQTTVEGFGSGQGMERTQSGTGPEPDIPDERGFPRTTNDEAWPKGSEA